MSVYTILIVYFAIGLIFYSTMAIVRRHTFKNATLIGIIGGFILSTLLLPVGVYIMIKYGKESEGEG